MRGIVLMVTTAIVMLVAVLIGGAVFVPLSDQVQSYDTVDSKYTGAIDDMEQVVQVWMPLILMGGSVLTAGLIALRRSRRTSRGGGGLR